MVEFIVGGSTRIVTACTVNQHIAGAKIVQYLLVYLLQIVTVKHICLVCLCNTAFRVNLVGYFLRCFLVKVEHSDLAARCCEFFCKHAADSAARAGYHTDFTGQIGIQYILCHGTFLLFLCHKRHIVLVYLAQAFSHASNRPFR